MDAGTLSIMSFLLRVSRHPILISLAVGIGIVVQWGQEVLFSRALGRPLNIDEPVVFACNALFTAMPLIALALQKRQHLLAWVVGFAPSVWLTWWWLQKGIAYQRNPDGSGVDMGGAVIMLIAPFLITAVCFWLNMRLSRER
jgi:hypothetical protein